MVVAAVDCTFYASFLSCFSFSSRDPCFHHSHRVIVGSRDSFSKRLVELHWKIFFSASSLFGHLCLKKRWKTLRCCVMKKRKAIQSCYFGLYKKPSFFFVWDQFDDNNDDATRFTERLSWEFLDQFCHFSKCRIHFTEKNSLIYHLTVNSRRSFFLLCNHKFSISQLWLVDCTTQRAENLWNNTRAKRAIKNKFNIPIQNSLALTRF